MAYYRREQIKPTLEMERRGDMVGEVFVRFFATAQNVFPHTAPPHQPHHQNHMFHFETECNALRVVVVEMQLSSTAEAPVPVAYKCALSHNKMRSCVKFDMWHRCRCALSNSKNDNSAL